MVKFVSFIACYFIIIHLISTLVCQDSKFESCPSYLNDNDNGQTELDCQCLSIDANEDGKEKYWIINCRENICFINSISNQNLSCRNKIFSSLLAYKETSHSKIWSIRLQCLADDSLTMSKIALTSPIIQKVQENQFFYGLFVYPAHGMSIYSVCKFDLAQQLSDAPLISTAVQVKKLPLSQTITAFSVLIDVKTIARIKYDVFYFGTKSGQIIKGVASNKWSHLELLRKNVSAQPIQKIEIKEDMLLVKDKDKGYEIPLHTCGLQYNCRKCIQLKDPHCAWDMDKLKCVSHQEIRSESLQQNMDENIDISYYCQARHSRSPIWKERTGKKCKAAKEYEIHDAHGNIKDCGKCHPECIFCDGPSEKQCQSCEHFAIKLNDTHLHCVANCNASNQYEDHDEHIDNIFCNACHLACDQSGCHGGSQFVRKDGCKRCLYGIWNNTEMKCIHKSNPWLNNVCKEHGLDGNYLENVNAELTQHLCKKCDLQCSNCESLGNDVHKNSCVCKNVMYLVNNSATCVKTCPSDITNFNSTHCIKCHPLCNQAQGCSGTSATQCFDCAHVGILEANVLRCVKSCPEGIEVDKDTKQCLSRGMKFRQAIINALYISIPIIIIVLIAILWILYSLKTKSLSLSKRLAKKVPSSTSAIVINERNGLVDSRESIEITERLVSINSKDLKRSKKLSEGAFGIVYQGSWQTKKVAIKVIKGHDAESIRSSLAYETNIMVTRQHEFLHNLLGICMNKEIQLVSKLRKGNLKEFLKENENNIPKEKLTLYCYQIASAMEYLASESIIHRDLAARNVLVKNENHIEVSDFGLSKMLKHRDTVRICNDKVAILWLAIECLKEQAFSIESDVWAFGVTCWEIFNYGRKFPYQDEKIGSIERLIHFLEEEGGRLKQNPRVCDDETYLKIFHCWTINPQARITFSQLKCYFYEIQSNLHLRSFESNIIRNERSPSPSFEYNSDDSIIV